MQLYSVRVDDNDDSADVSGNDPPQKMQRSERQTRSQSKVADVEKQRAEMPTAQVCIQYDASLWPDEVADFTDGVQQVFLVSDEDGEDDVPLGALLLPTDCNERGEWVKEARRELEKHSLMDRGFENASGLGPWTWRLQTQKQMESENQLASNGES